LIRRADVVISHGGFNTVKEAAAAGVPSLVLPVSGPVTDAGRTGALVEYLGLGAVLPEERLQVGRMTRLVRDLSRTAAVCRAYASNLVDSGPDPAEIVLARLR
jgi:UDP:flavonoid glycosyltransferase YjiC (YdhE family)